MSAFLFFSFFKSKIPIKSSCEFHQKQNPRNGSIWGVGLLCLLATAHLIYVTENELCWFWCNVNMTCPWQQPQKVSLSPFFTGSWCWQLKRLHGPCVCASTWQMNNPAAYYCSVHHAGCWQAVEQAEAVRVVSTERQVGGLWRRRKPSCTPLALLCGFVPGPHSQLLRLPRGPLTQRFI